MADVKHAGPAICKLCGRHSSRTTRLHDQCEGYTSGTGTAAALHAFLAGKRPPGIHFWADLTDPDTLCPPHKVRIVRVNSAAVAKLHTVATQPPRQLCRLQTQPLVTSTSERARLLRLRVIAKEHRSPKSSSRRVLRSTHWLDCPLVQLELATCSRPTSNRPPCAGRIACVY